MCTCKIYPIVFWNHSSQSGNFPYPYHSHRFNHLDSINGNIQNMKFIIQKLSLISIFIPPSTWVQIFVLRYSVFLFIFHICDCRNISVELLRVCMCLSSGNLISSVRVALSFPIFVLSVLRYFSSHVIYNIYVLNVEPNFLKIGF